MVVSVVVLALAIRFAFSSSAPPFIHADSEGYFLPAHDLANGAVPEFGLRRTPTYPLFIAATIRLVGEDLQRLVTVQHLLFGPAIAALTYLLGRLLTGRAVAFGAALLTAVSGSLLVTEHYILTESLFTLLLVGTLVVLILATRRTSVALAAATGLIFGALILCRPSAQILLPLIIGALVLGTGSGRQRFRSLISFTVATGAVVVPWMTWNYVHHDTFAVSSNGRFLLARALRNDRGGFSFEKPPGLVEDSTRAAARRIVQEEAARRSPGSSTQRMRNELGLSEAESSRILSEIAVQAIRSRPDFWLRGSAAFFWEILVGRPISIRMEGLEWKEIDWDRRIRSVLTRPIQPLEQGRAQTIVGIYDPSRFGPFVPILFLAGILLIATGSAPRSLLLPGFTAIALVAGSAALVGPVPRYRYPLDPLITLIAVQSIVTATQLARASVTRLLAASGTRSGEPLVNR
jgi:4-amino-4-deoxy-L-arabinose transferase-like glycosyltransferase